jgi:acetolactate synthase-1/2/3 large subunit
MNPTLPYTVADCIAAHLSASGIERVFVYPGGTIVPLVNGFLRAGVAVEVFKHEQGAAYAALAVARLTGRPQVVMVTSGPGVTNVLTPLADAWFDSTPLLLITGQVGTGDLTSGRRVRQRGFQEVPTLDLVKPISKAACCPMSADAALAALPRLLAEAVNGRPGPVVLDLPMDVQRTPCAEYLELPDAAPGAVGDDVGSDVAAMAVIADIAAALAAARRPMLLLGQGAVQPANAQLPALLQALVARTQALVVTSLPGLGAWDGNDANCLGYIGHTGHAGANSAVHSADLLLVLC